MELAKPEGAGTKRVLAIDPGTYSSGVVVYDYDAESRGPGKVIFHSPEFLNSDLMDFLRYGIECNHINEAAIEMVGYYGTGMTVGKLVFHTVIWIGRFYATLERYEVPVTLYLRKSIAYELCGNRNAKEKNINQACRDWVGERGTSKEPGPTYGVTDHAWSALAVAVCHSKEIAPVDYPGEKENSSGS